MKKIFTLIAMAIMAVGANAQETYAIPEALTPSANQKIADATASVALTFGNDTWNESKKTNLGDFSYYVSAKSNPKGDGNNVAYTEENKTLPDTGGYFILEPSKTGYITAGVQLNAEKSFYVIDGNGNNMDSSLELKNSEGTVLTLAENNGKVYSLAEKTNLFVKFPVAAGGKYYVFCTGSKLGFFGFSFVEDESAATYINALKVNATQNGEAFNLAGQKVNKNFKGVVIQNGKKVVIK